MRIEISLARSGLTTDDVPLEITTEAERFSCCDKGAEPGFGYDGGGFGPYRICKGCGSIFGKRAVRDGNAEGLAA